MPRKQRSKLTLAIHLRIDVVAITVFKFPVGAAVEIGGRPPTHFAGEREPSFARGFARLRAVLVIVCPAAARAGILRDGGAQYGCTAHARASQYSSHERTAEHIDLS